MEQSMSSRRTLLKASAATAGVGVIGALSGCSNNQQGTTTGGGQAGGDTTTTTSGSQGGGETVSPDNAETLVPSQADLLFGVDFDRIRNDQGLRRIMNAGAEEGGQASVDQFFQTAESQYGLDPAKFHSFMIFSSVPEHLGLTSTGGGASDTYSGGLIFADYNLDNLVSKVPTDYSSSTYQGTTVYENNTGSRAAQVNGVIVFSSSSTAGNPVEDVIDIAMGNSQAVSGKLVTMYNNTRQAPLRFAVELPFETSTGSTPAPGQMEIASKIEFVSGSIGYKNGNNRGVRVNMELTDQETATETKQQLTAVMSQYETLLSQQAEQDPDAKKLSELLSKVSVSQSGKVVSVSFEDSVDNIVASIEAGGSFAGGATGGGGSQYTTYTP